MKRKKLEIPLSDFKTCNNHKSIKVDTETNGIQNPEKNSSIHGEMIFDKGVMTTHRGKSSLFNKWCKEN